jgi:hypothetical protein
MDQECCGGACRSGADGVRRCALLPQCRVQGETCGAAGDCCSGRCVSTPTGPMGPMGPANPMPPVNASTGALTCATLPGCHVAEEICKDDKDCCSGACLAATLGGQAGPKRCADLSGCSSAGERCVFDGSCCSGVCAVEPEGIARCKAMGCRQAGERCGKSDECCGKGADACRPDGAGVRRCQAPSAIGAACGAEGFGCALPEQCCSGFCLPDTTGALYCRAACAPVGAPCAGAKDCCAGECGGEPGRTVCLTPVDLQGAPPTCLQLGADCDVKAARCCGGAVCATVNGGRTACALPIVE